MSEYCENCKYWKKVTQFKFEGVKKDAGQCRKHPPSGYYSSIETSPNRVVRYRFPYTACDDWCGEYTSKD